MNKDEFIRSKLMEKHASDTDYSRLKIKLLDDGAPAPQPQKPKPNPNFISVLRKEGVPIVDRLQQAIKYHQDIFVSLRSISIRPTLYHALWNYFNARSIKLGLGEIPKEITLTMFDVDIKKGSKFQTDDMYFEAYRKKDENDSFFGSRIRKPYEA